MQRDGGDGRENQGGPPATAAAVGPCLGGAVDAEWSDHLCKCAICSGAAVNTETYFLIFSGLQTSRQRSCL